MRRKKPFLKYKKNIRSIRRQKLDNETSRKYIEVFNKIISNPNSPHFVLNKEYHHYKLDYNIFITVCFDNENSVDEAIVYESMIGFSYWFSHSHSDKEKQYIFSDIFDYLMSVKSISGIINIAFNPANIDEIALLFSEREKYFDNVVSH